MDRALSKLGIASRTRARLWISEGRIHVDGKLIKSPSFQVFPERAKITVNEVRVEQQQPITVMLYKPKGVVTTLSDEKGRPTVYSCLENLKTHVVPVGRLDFMTTGLLLLTNDTRFAAWITEPAHQVRKIYQVTVRGEFTAEKGEQACRGVRVADQSVAGEILKAVQVDIEKASGRETHLLMSLEEGKNREIRRLLLALGHEVTRLKRVAFGGLALGELKPGEWRTLREEELFLAFPGAPIRLSQAASSSKG